ncbi:helix-turn-helix domain-containing protein [Litorisediminicola beolgyonensis]|uniref:Helix-turn-helix domain-containing protein n=1 Tax=Litorisediminicola beolgyonensis TaxID=1173614 RepID=A0ABW3ZLW2_9RHOB
MDLGTRLKSLRVSKGLSQRELARRAGVTNGLISQIEQNRSSPSVASLKRILDAVPISFADFFSEQRDDSDRAFPSLEHLASVDPGRYHHAGSDAPAMLRVGGDGPGRAELLYETYLPGSDSGPSRDDRLVGTTGLVLWGEIEAQIGFEIRTLTRGASFIATAGEPHRFRNRASDPCVLVTARLPPPR